MQCHERQQMSELRAILLQGVFVRHLIEYLVTVLVPWLAYAVLLEPSRYPSWGVWLKWGTRKLLL